MNHHISSIAIGINRTFFLWCVICIPNIYCQRCELFFYYPLQRFVVNLSVGYRLISSHFLLCVQIHKAILVLKNHPEAFSEKQRNYIKKLQSQITETDEKVMSEVFLALHLGVVVDPPSYTVEDIKELSKDGIFFAKEELEDILDWQLSPSNKKHDPELVVFVSEQLDNHFYFETIEEAETASE